LQSRRLAESFHGLNSSLTQSTGENYGVAKWHENSS